MAVFADTNGGTAVSTQADTGLDFTSATEDSSGEGYAWDNTSSTLTLDGINLNVESGNAITLPAGATIEIKENTQNFITTQAGTIIESKGNLSIKGSGLLTGESVAKSDDYYGIRTNGGNLEISQCTLDLTITPNWSSEVITTAVYEGGKWLDKGGDFSLINGANVTLKGKENRGWGLCTGKYGSSPYRKEGGNILIDVDTSLTVDAFLGFFIRDNGTVDIRGTFDTSKCPEDGLAANVLTHNSVKISGKVIMSDNQYMDTRGSKLEINPSIESTGSIINVNEQDDVSLFVLSNKRAFDIGWSPYCVGWGVNKLYVAAGAVFTIIPTNEEEGPYPGVNQTLKLIPEKLSDISGAGYVKVEEGGIVELKLDGATAEQVQALDMFCGKVKINNDTPVQFHAGGTATCKEKAVCAVCGEKYGEVDKTNHSGTLEWITDANTHEQKCLDCGETVIAKSNHEFENQVCKICGYKYTSSGGGSYNPVQKPEIITGEGGKTSLENNGTTLVITPDDGMQISKVTVNGNEVTVTDNKVTGLKTGDKVEVTFTKIPPTKEELDKKFKEKAGEIDLVVRTSKTSKNNIKVTVKLTPALEAFIKEIKSAGYTVKYKFYRSANKSSKYAARITKEEAEYLNTEGKKDKKYYYKAKLLIYDNEGNLVAQTELKQCKYGLRTWSK
ncbi:MAG: hypothetical protein UEP31_06275 [Anaerovoracaceae bacterium]|nr:hypothetical protein [Anaerovoracaceae bacterium]